MKTFSGKKLEVGMNVTVAMLCCWSPSSWWHLFMRGWGVTPVKVTAVDGRFAVLERTQQVQTMLGEGTVKARHYFDTRGMRFSLVPESILATMSVVEPPAPLTDQDFLDRMTGSQPQ